MRIKTKLESIEAIKRLGLNQFQEIFLTEVDESKINSFMQETGLEWYDVRDKTVAASPKAKKLMAGEVIAYCKENKMEKFTVSISFNNYREQCVCVGEMCIRNDSIDYFISNKVCSPRDLLKNPDYSGTADIFDKKLKRIKGLQAAVDYAFEHDC